MGERLELIGTGHEQTFENVNLEKAFSYTIYTFELIELTLKISIFHSAIAQ